MERPWHCAERQFHLRLVVAKLSLETVLRVKSSLA
jgi:hypothetical protein